MIITPRNISLCIAQINYNSGNIQAHVERIKDIISENSGCDLIIFPELMLHGHPSFEKPEGFLYRKMKVVYSSVSEDLYRFVQGQDARVIIGELKRRGERYYNVATYVDRETIQSYVKTHVHWTENFFPGREIRAFDTPLGKIGINICYDAAFMEVWRVLALTGALIIVNISAVPRHFPVRYMWRRMAGAAIFNEVFVVYANRPGELFSGHSAVFDPQGERMVSAGENETILHASINLDKVEEWRNAEPVMEQRRPLLYRRIGLRQPAALEDYFLNSQEEWTSGRYSQAAEGGAG